MSIRTRKFVGTIALLVLVAVWGLLAMALAQSVLTDINGFVAAICYIVAGLGWVVPAMPLINWMAPRQCMSCIFRRETFYRYSSMRS
jgi:NhaP-type Na+/H+ or K+/H+ antiporter